MIRSSMSFLQTEGSGTESPRISESGTFGPRIFNSGIYDFQTWDIMDKTKPRHSHLDANDYFVISPETDTHLRLIVSLDGEPSVAVGPTNEEDYRWRSVKVSDNEADGYHLVSKSNMVLEYLQNQGEKIAATPFIGPRKHTVWHTSPENEIYTTSIEGDKKYIWIVGSHLYVTPDEHLSQAWAAHLVSKREDYTMVEPPRTKDISSSRFIGGFLLVCFLIVAFYLLVGHSLFGTVYED